MIGINDIVRMRSGDYVYTVLHEFQPFRPVPECNAVFPKKYASFCNPPLSVATKRQCFNNSSISKYPTESVVNTSGFSFSSSSFFLVLGCSGSTTRILQQFGSMLPQAASGFEDYPYFPLDAE